MEANTRNVLLPTSSVFFFCIYFFFFVLCVCVCVCMRMLLLKLLRNCTRSFVKKKEIRKRCWRKTVLLVAVVEEADSDGACLNIWRQTREDWRWCQQLTFSFIPPIQLPFGRASAAWANRTDDEGNKKKKKLDVCLSLSYSAVVAKV